MIFFISFITINCLLKRLLIILIFSYFTALIALRLTFSKIMDNFDDFKNKSYVGAQRLQYKFSDNLQFFCKCIVALLKFISVIVVSLCINILKLFVRIKPKDVSGQLALVTGW